MREALMAVFARVIDEYRFGLREVSLEELRELAGIWSDLNGGETPAETMLRLFGRLRQE